VASAVTDVDPNPIARRRAWLRIGALVGTLAALAAVFTVGGLVGTDAVRDRIEPAGAWAPLAFVLVSGVAVALLVPGAVMAAASGLLFGAVAGALLIVPAAVLSALLARSFSARIGADALTVVGGERTTALVGFARRHGLTAVVVSRLAPAVPDAPMNHAFGLAGVRAWQVALGTALASGPRGLSYAMLGASADDLTGTQAIAGVALNVATGVVGVALVAWVVRSERRRRAQGVRPRSPTADRTP